MANEDFAGLPPPVPPDGGADGPTVSIPHLVQLLRKDQQRRWRQGESILVEAYGQRYPVLRANVEGLLDLIYQEVLLREERGDRPQVDEYVGRFPELADLVHRQFQLHRAASAGVSAEGDSHLPTLPPPLSAGAPETPGPARTPPAAPSASSIADGDAASPRPVPGYEILKELGRGGMGVVYQARQVRLNRVVALKMVLAGGHASPAELVRFLSEAEAVASLQHPNIVQLYEAGKHDGLPYFTLEFVAGGSLHAKWAGTPLQAPEAARLVEQLARAIHYAHQHGIVHRDLKPGNVLLTEDGTPKVTDFGLAKRVEAGSGITASGAIMGTPSYMAPEQAAGLNKRVGPPADIYALGAILYDLVTGRPPFRAATAMDTLLQVISDEPVPPRRLVPKLPRDLDTICLKCLEKDATRRYPSAAALADDLHRFLNDDTIRARPPSVWDRAVKVLRRNARTVAVSTAAVLLTVLLAGLGIAQIHRAQTNKLRQFVAQGRDLLEQAAVAPPEKADRLFDEASHAFAAALAIDERDSSATQGRLDVYLRRCRQALDRGAYDEARGILLPLRALDRDGTYAEEIAALERRAQGTGRWRLETTPPGSQASLLPLDGNLRPGKPVALGRTPLDWREIAPGGYVVELQQAGHAETRYPLLVGHGQEFDLRVRMVPAAQVPKDMVYVPEGEFRFGDPAAGARTVRLKGFLIDKTEVTGAAYEKFVQETGWPPPDSWDGPSCPSPLRDSAVFNVSWLDALEYARWAGKRLPTETEWEKAARGVDGRAFPWGNRFDMRFCNCRETAVGEGLMVGRRRAGASPYGCLDLAGNVWEWTLDREKRHRPDRVIRGGAAHSTPDELLAYRRKSSPIGGSSYGGLNLLGFRCVKPLDPEPETSSRFDALTTRDDLDDAAEYFWDHQRFDLVEECARRLLRLNARSVPGLFWRGLCRQRANDFDGALADLRLVYLQRPQYHNRGEPRLRSVLPTVIYNLKKQGKKVDEEFWQALVWFPKARLALQRKQYKEAEETLQKVLKEDPDHPLAHESMAEVCEATGRAQEAARHREKRVEGYRAELREQPEDPELCHDFAEFLGQHDLHLDEAVSLARRAVELQPDVAAYHQTLAEISHQMGRTADAVASIKQAMELDPEEEGYRETLRTYQTALKVRQKGK